MHTDKPSTCCWEPILSFYIGWTGLRIKGSYRFDVLDAKALERRIDGMVVSPLPDTAWRQCLDVFQYWLLVRFDHLTLAGILAMLGALTPLEQTRDYRDIVEKNRLISLDEGRQEGRGSSVRLALCCCASFSAGSVP